MIGTDGVVLPVAAEAGGAVVSAPPASSWPVLLISMPFTGIDQPSIQIGLLAAITRSHGYPVRTLHANLDLAARIGVDHYRALAEHRGRMLGEWLFSVAAFGDSAPDPDDRLLDDFADELAYLESDIPDWRTVLPKIRHSDIPAYLDDLVDGLSWQGVRVVGFSSTFQQNTASFALARRLKQRHPRLVTVFGGANFDGEMGLEFLRRMPWIDLIVTGEGDLAFPRLLDALRTGTDAGAVPGVARRDDQRLVATPAAPPMRRMDDLPVPDYAEYFDRRTALGLLAGGAAADVRIPFESARGCWWGEKHHCVFCGLNGTGMGFRSKSADRVLAELAEQARRYRSFRFDAVDNILDVHYLRDVLPRLVEAGTDYDLFYEVKANLTRAQLRLLAHAGVSRIQPGIESLSSRVLGLMRKGVRAAQNVNLLRWTRYYGIHVDWNILWGFPGESARDYAAQAALMPHLVHLQPPSGGGRIWMERFSPLYTDADRLGVRRREPEGSYRYVYPDTVDLERAAYFFEYELADALPDDAYDGVRHAVSSWQRAWEKRRRPVLRYWSAPGLVQIYDGRHQGREGTYTFEGPLADVYLACSERPITAAAISARLGRRLPAEAVGEVLTEFAGQGLTFLDGDLALSLALPAVRGR